MRVVLTAVIDDFRKQMRSAADATGQVGKAAEGAEKQSSKLGDAGRAVGKAALTGLALATTATVGLGTAAFRAGVQYNNLEQQSRTALTTMLGSAEAASDQMEKLVAWGKTSPFPRQVWLEAQTQLIGFGLEAERVIPTLSAIQDAAAATGRTSAADIGEIVNVFAKIQGTGRITARELNQLGIRGIDAAGLLADAYGTTADRIRDDITSGALDGRQALVDLTDQMSIRFAGAAEGLRQTWFGAVDRIKGAFRDIGSILAGPFVDPQGGGAAVDWANALADAMRALETVLGPVVQNIATRFGPAFDSVTATLERAAGALRGADVDHVTDQLTRFAPAVAALGAAGLAAGAGGLPGILGRLGRTLVPGGPLVAGIGAFVLSSPQMRDLLRELFDAVKPLIPLLFELASDIMPMLITTIDATAETLKPLVALIGEVVDSTVWWGERLKEFGLIADNTAENTDWWKRSIADLLGWTDRGAESTMVAAEATGFFGLKAKEVRERAYEMLPAIQENAVAFDDAAVATEEAEEALTSYLDTVKRATDPVYALHGALGDVDKAQRDYNEAVKEYGEGSKEAQDAAFNLMGKLDDLEAAALNGELSFEEFEARLDEWVRQEKITAEAADDIRERVKDLREEAEDYADDYNATVSQTGADATMRKIRDVKALIESFKNKGITLTVHAQTGSFKIIGQGFAGSLAEGGPVFGGGTGTSDSVPAWLSRGEHVWTAKEVSNAGGHEAVEAIRDHFRFAKGGGLGRLTINTKGRDPNLFATDFSDSFARTLGRDAARAGKTLASVTPGRVLPRGSYRIGMPYLGYPGHYGADYPAPPMTPVYAMAAGVVERAMRMATSYGNHIFLKHANGIQTRYAHMLGLRATAGQMVGPGQHIGWVGSTGNSTGPHLHFEYRRNGAPINPATLGIFDSGGRVRSGAGMLNFSGGTESVLSPRQSVMFDRMVGAMERSGSSGGGSAASVVEVRISGDGALAETFKASHRKGEVKILVNGQTAQVV